MLLKVTRAAPWAAVLVQPNDNSRIEVEPVAEGPDHATRIEHERGCFKTFLSRCEPGSPVAVETVGNGYWIVEEIEAAGMMPKLVRQAVRLKNRAHATLRMTSQR